MRLSNRTLQPLPAWQSENLFFSATAWFSHLMQDIQQATRTVDIQTYIFEMDSVGQPLLDALCAAAQRGVQVRVIVDGVGSARAAAQLQQQLSAQGASFQIYHPLPWEWVSTQLEKDAWFLRAFKRLLYINERQHSKLCLIDENIAWVGSFNITDDHIENNGKGLDWKDCGARVTGERCLLFREFFDAIWFDDVKKLSPRFLFHPITNVSRLLRKRRLRTLLQSIFSAKENVWVISAYFSPVQSIIRALKKAAKRGVDVRVMVPAHSDVAFFPALASTYYADLLKAGVHIYEYKGGILHTKMLLVDSDVYLGSSNMNHRSILHDVELDIQLFSDISHRDAKTDFVNSLQSCREITVENLSKFYTWLLVLGQIPRWLRYWL